MPVVNATKTVVGVFDRMDDAQNAVRALENAGISRDDISVIANKNVADGHEAAAGETTHEVVTEKGSNVATDAGIGAALGGVGGLLLSFAGLAIPGVGPVLAIGPIVAALSGAGIGAVAGGIIGALTESGVPEEEAHYYAEGVRRGQVLVTVRTVEATAERAQEVLDSSGAIDVEGRVENWRERGWTNYNSGAEPLSADELRREREYYGAADRQGVEWSATERSAQPSATALSGAGYPHTDARDIGDSRPRAEAQNAAVDRERPISAAPQPMEDASRDTGAMVGDVSRPLTSDRDSPSNYGDAIENNVRRPDPATVRAERGFERSKDSAVASARRMARVYNSTR